MTTDKTGAETAVTQESDRFSIAVEGKTVGFTEFKERDGRRIFIHTEIDDDYQGRALASILIGEALTATKAAGLRIVPVCSAVANYVRQHGELADAVDTPDNRRR